MRTKTLLFLATATLAVGLTTSKAQVFSANVVGYYSVPAPAGTLVLTANSLDDGNGNQLTNVLAGLPNKSSAQVWNGSGFDLYTKNASGWLLNGVLTNTTLPVGTGFFIKAFSTATNIFVGNIPTAPGQIGSLPLTNGVLQLVGGFIPFQAPTLDDTNLNIGPSLANKSSIQVWNGTGYNLYTKNASGWLLNGVLSNTNIALGEGFFVKSFTATNWTEQLPQ